METKNGREGLEDARQIAPGVAGIDAETRRVWLGLALVVAVFLLLPGCSYTAPANPVPETPTSWPDVAVVVVCLAFVALLVGRAHLNVTRSKIGVEWRQEDDGVESEDGANKKPDPALRAFDKFVVQVANEKAARIAAETRVRDLEAALAKANARVRELEISAAVDRKTIEYDAAALDACAALLDGKRGEDEWAAARTALRATGRLGGTTEPKPEAATLCRCGHANSAHMFVAGVRTGECLGKLPDGHFCPCRALDATASAQVQG